MDLRISILMLFIFAFHKNDGSKGDEGDVDETDKHGVREPTPCEVCRILAFELNEQLLKTDKKETILIGHALDGDSGKRAKKIDYQRSESRLVEVLEQVCSDIEKYQIHAEHKRGVMRYRKHMSTTMSTLNGLRMKGVKVELGIPEDLWNATSAETSKLKRQCDKLLEEAEESIEEWYMSDGAKPNILNFLCRERLLKGDADKICLDEFPEWNPNKQPKSDEEEEKKKESGKEKKDMKKKKKKAKTELWDLVRIVSEGATAKKLRFKTA